MSQFDYNAQCEGGAAISGTLEATDGAAATTQLSSMGLRNIALRESKRAVPRRPLGSDDFIFFNEQLASLASTGICLDAGLRQLGKDIRSRRLRNVLDTVAADIESGQPLDKALEKCAPQMPALYARVVRAGVANGQLPATLLNLSHHLRLVAETRRLVVEALTYPATVLVLAFGVLLAVMLMIVPQFSEIFKDFEVQLPGVTLAMIALARVIPELLVGLGIIILGLVTLFLMPQLIPSLRSARERVILAVPVFGSMICDSLRTRFIRAMAFAVDSGIPLPEAMRLSAGATASLAMARDADGVASRVEQGTAVYEACQGADLIPAMFGYVVTVGSNGGNLRDALIQLSKAYESRVVYCQSLLRGWLTPAAIVGVGLVIGLVILALFMPMVSLMNSI